MNGSDDLRCVGCGSTNIGHLRGRTPRGKRVWRNRCRQCGLESEYVPTLRDIRAACRRIRAEHLAWMAAADAPLVTRPRRRQAS